MTTAERIWSGILHPDKGDLIPAVAKHFLSFALTEEDKKHYAQLASQERAKLSESERSELIMLEQIDIIVALLQRKAQLSLGGQKA